MHQRSLRTRLLVTFGLGSFVLSSLFASLTYFGVLNILINNQQNTDLKQSYENATLVRNTLATNPSELTSTLNSIEKATNTQVLVRTQGQWLSESTGAQPPEISASAIAAADKGIVTEQTVRFGNQDIYIVAIPIPSVHSQYFEVFGLSSLSHTLRTLLELLGLGALAISGIGIVGGLWATRRAVRPLQEVSEAAALIAEGELSTRLSVSNADREVQQLSDSFNEMVSQLVERLERDARFASDVSHELRSPLTTVVTTAAVLQQHRAELSPAGQESLDLLSADLTIFQALVEDLLEMARNDAGATPHVSETVAAVELVNQSARSASRRLGIDVPPIELGASVKNPYIIVDRRRFERVIANLLDNATRYASGAVAIRVECIAEHFIVNVDDAGSGISAEERMQVFERFFRGRMAHDRSSVRGTGLGLALVKEHILAFNGSIAALESPEGGARMQISIPISSEEYV